MILNLIDDFQSSQVPVQPTSPIVPNPNIQLILADEYLASNLQGQTLYQQYDPSQYADMVFVINIEDDYALMNDEYVLITEDGIAISLEDYNNQDEIIITVR